LLWTPIAAHVRGARPSLPTPLPSGQQSAPRRSYAYAHEPEHLRHHLIERGAGHRLSADHRPCPYHRRFTTDDSRLQGPCRDRRAIANGYGGRVRAGRAGVIGSPAPSPSPTTALTAPASGYPATQRAPGPLRSERGNATLKLAVFKWIPSQSWSNLQSAARKGSREVGAEGLSNIDRSFTHGRWPMLPSARGSPAALSTIAARSIAPVLMAQPANSDCRVATG
jgi:hypothetical protein